MLKIVNLTVGYKENRPVLKNLNLGLKSNSVHGLVGLNGSGKTTLLNTLYKLIRKSSGDITYKDLVLHRQNIGFLEAENFFYSNITGNEYLSLFKNSDFDIEKWNSLFKLPLNDFIENYSTGMKKKLSFLGVLKLNREILILDEPFNGLDLETVRIVKNIILTLKQSKTIIVTSHILESLGNICDEIHYLNDGEIKFSVLPKDYNSLELLIFKESDYENQSLISSLI